jgi:S-adenosylmethionine:tRNA ribosyltransferase-isomerase
MQLADFNFTLPPELIAPYPLEKRSASRLLHLGSKGRITHTHFTNLLDYISAKDLLVFNQSKVIPARLRGHKETGGRVEILVERLLDDKQLLVHLKASKTPAVGSYLHFAEHYRFQVLGRRHNLFILQAADSFSIMEAIEKIGEIPLPHYLRREAEAADKERYQTIYAQEKGSVAAPTAGLHFDEAMMDSLRAAKVDLAFLTLHVGAGTFLPVRTANIREHAMHPEYVQVSAAVCEKVRQAKARGGRVIAVGTTSARSLEAASQQGDIQPYAGDTDLFIYPGYRFNCIDALITNFHIPESTLLMLVCAVGGHQEVLEAYRQAVAERYRFYSYGDAMFVTKAYT